MSKITNNIPKAFGLTCCKCQDKATHVECGGYKYCLACAMDSIRYRSNTNIIVSMELLQALRGFCAIPDRFMWYSTKEQMYTDLITNKTFGGSLVHCAIFDATFHVRSESSSLIWDKVMQREFGKLMKQSLNWITVNPQSTGYDILVKW